MEDDEKQLMGTIQFPKNLKFLNENLPESKYEEEGESNEPKFRTLKII